MQMSVEDMKALFRSMLQQDEAGLFASTIGTNPPIKYMTLALDEATPAGKPFRLNFGFRSFVVLNTTDSSVSINMQLGDETTNIDAFPIKNNSSLKLPYPVQKAFLTWDAQPSKTISILFFLRGEFATNQLVSSVAATMTPYVGDAVATQPGAQVDTTAAELFAQDTTRKEMVIQNQSGQSIWIGSSTVTAAGGASPGIEIQPGGSFSWQSTAACYAITTGAATAATAISLTRYS